jgi:hypothetical protein
MGSSSPNGSCRGPYTAVAPFHDTVEQSALSYDPEATMMATGAPSWSSAAPILTYSPPVADDLRISPRHPVSRVASGISPPMDGSRSTNSPWKTCIEPSAFAGATTPNQFTPPASDPIHVPSME